MTSFAGYLVIMRIKTFTIGDRIKMGGVRGDVISLGLLADLDAAVRIASTTLEVTVMNPS